MQPANRGALDLLGAATEVIGRPAPGSDWPWPEPRLTYANAVLPEALLAAGAALDAPALVADGLRLLGWLLDAQTRDGHLSVVPVGGRGPLDSGPGFDQQPIEAAALADACARAHTITGQDRWLDGINRAAAWFLGANDAGVSLYDPGERRRLRRVGARRPQREPGRGVHSGAGVDAAAGPRAPPREPARDTRVGTARRRVTPTAQTSAETRPRMVTRLDAALTADPARVLARLFVPGHELVANTESRATGVLARILALSEHDVRRTLRRRARPLRRAPPGPGRRARRALRPDRPSGSRRRCADPGAAHPHRRVVHP